MTRNQVAAFTLAALATVAGLLWANAYGSLRTQIQHSRAAGTQQLHRR